MIGLWSGRWIRFGCVGLMGLALVAGLVGWAWWMRVSPEDAVSAGDMLGLKARVLLGASLTGWRSEDGATLLFRAVQSDKPEMIKYLIAHGADPNRDGRDKETPLGAAISWRTSPTVNGGSPETVAALLRCGADPNAPDEFGNTPLWHALTEGRADLVRVLLDAGVDASQPDVRGSPPLLLAVWAKQRDAAEVLLDYGADVGAETGGGEPVPDEYGRAHPEARTVAMTALTAAIDADDVDVVRVLLEHGANPDHKPEGLFRPVVWAVMRGRTEIVRALLEYGASPNLCNGDVLGPLHLAAESGRLAAAVALLDAGADPNAVQTRWWYGKEMRETPLDLAASPEIVGILQAYGATKRITTTGAPKRLGA